MFASMLLPQRGADPCVRSGFGVPEGVGVGGAAVTPAQYLSMTPPWLSVGVLQVPRPWRQHAAEAPRGSEGRRSGRHFQHSVLSAV